jgi:DNA-directed RNA polymerase specialized sigma24 family protein
MGSGEWHAGIGHHRPNDFNNLNPRRLEPILLYQYLPGNEDRAGNLASVHERRGCVHRERALSPEDAEWLASRLEAVQLHLDVLCRFALILCGVEQRSTTEASQMLGMSKHAVKGAYCAALELEIIYSAFLLESYEGSSEVN